MDSTPQHASASALVIGATGAVGSEIVKALLAASWCARVTTLARRASDQWDQLPGRAKLTQEVIAMEGDGAAIAAAVRPHDLAFNALGLPRPSKVAPEELVRVDHSWAVAFARACRDAGVKHFGHLSAVGANARSSVRYLRVKGEIEADLRALAFPRLAIFRPSILVTEANRFGALDVFNRKVFPALSWALPRSWHEVKVSDLGHALAAQSQAPMTGPVEVLTWREMRPFFA